MTTGTLSKWAPRGFAVASVGALALLNVVVAPPAGATTINGGDKAGADVTVANGDVLSGAFTNVGTFTVPAGATVTVAAGSTLSIQAQTIVIAGTLDASGAGGAGGVATNVDSADGVAGTGTGAGGGGIFGACVHGSGGGGGAYGGAGGNSSYDGNIGGQPGAGGAVYGTTAGSDIAAGSGGGSGANHCASFAPYQASDGGAGGGAVTLQAHQVTISGAVLADGANGVDGNSQATYGDAAGGGGSGGGILVMGGLQLTGTLSATGGAGGNASPGVFAQSGGGGGGGRVKVVACTAGIGSPTVQVTGGAAGTRTGEGTAAVAGVDGTYSSTVDATMAVCNAVPVSTTTTAAPSSTMTTAAPAVQPAVVAPTFTG